MKLEARHQTSDILSQIDDALFAVSNLSAKIAFLKIKYLIYIMLLCTLHNNVERERESGEDSRNPL